MKLNQKMERVAKCSFVIGVTFWAIVGCQQRQQVVTSDGLDPTFDKFYLRFHEDSAFQMSHILFPLSGKIGDSIDQSTKWTRQGWRLHSLEHFEPSEFSQQFVWMDSTLVIEKFQHQKYPLHIERRFAKDGDDWLLIYYRVPK